MDDTNTNLYQSFKIYKINNLHEEGTDIDQTSDPIKFGDNIILVFVG